MEKFKLYLLNNKKIFIIAGCILAIAICSIGCYFYYQYNIHDEVTLDDTLFNDIESDLPVDDNNNNDNNETNSDSETSEKLQDEVNNEKEEVQEVIEYIYVDIKGYVKKPGVYKVLKNDNKRICDLITLAGGLKKDADTSIINLSTKLKDEMVVIIYSKKEIKDFIKTKEALKEKTEICDKEEIKNDSCITKDDIENNFEGNNNNTSNEDNDSSDPNNNNDTNNNETTTGKVNINTASLELLMTLNGVGEAKARAIIDYRNKIGLFETIDDIKNVSGIGDKAFENIKDSITVK